MVPTVDVGLANRPPHGSEFLGAFHTGHVGQASAKRRDTHRHGALSSKTGVSAEEPENLNR